MSAAFATTDVKLSHRVSDAIGRLMTARHEGNSVRVSVPVLYPSGSGCSVEIVPNGDFVFVSDMGLGHMEAEFGGASEQYDKQAQRAANRFGVRYDGYSVFGLRISLDRIEGAIAAIANASVQAAGLAIMKSAEDKDRRTNDEIFDRLRSIFDPSLLSKTADIQGNRDSWQVHNVITFPMGQRAVFEFVTKHQASISSKFLMFSDLSASERGLSLNSVVKNISELGSKGAMLSDVSNVVEISAERSQFERLALRAVAA